MHFVVYVIGDEDLDRALEPFQQNNMGTVDDHYLEFIDKTEEVVEYWNDYPLNLLAHGGENYETIEAFATDYFGYEVQDGKYGYVENPNAQWDWWELGGRWGDHLPLCTGTNSSQAPIEMIDIDKMSSAAAMLYRGEWINSGINIWNATDEEEETWLNRIKALMSDLPPGTMVSVVDCHI